MQQPGPVPSGWRQTCPCMETERLHALLCCWGLLQHKQKLWYLAFDLYKGISPFLLRSTVQLKPGTCCQGAVCSVQLPGGNSCPQAGSGSKGAWTPRDHFSRWQRLVKEQGGSCWDLCVLQQKNRSRLTGGTALFTAMCIS